LFGVKNIAALCCYIGAKKRSIAYGTNYHTGVFNVLMLPKSSVGSSEVCARQALICLAGVFVKSGSCKYFSGQVVEMKGSSNITL